MSVEIVRRRTGGCRSSIGTLLVSMVLITGCQSVPLEIELSEVVAEPASFVLPGDTLRGFDAPGDTAIRDGDQVLFGLRLSDEGVEKTWFLNLTVLADVAVRDGRPWTGATTFTQDNRTVRLPTWLVPVRVTLLDAQGEDLGSSQVLLPGRVLENGFLEACQEARATVGDPQPASLEAVPDSWWQGMATMMSLMTLIQDEPLLADILWEVIDAPSLLGVIMNLGARPMITTAFEASKPMHPEIDGRTYDAERFPFSITVNGEAAFFAELSAVAPRSPLTVSGGMWQIVGHRPSKPEQKLELQVLAARRRSANAEPLGTPSFEPKIFEAGPTKRSVTFTVGPDGRLWPLIDTLTSGKAVSLPSSGILRFAPGATVLEIEK